MTTDFWAVTGATGYLGRALCADLAASSIPSRGLARGGAEIAGDIRDREAVRALVRGASVVVHLAAYVHRRRGSERECWSVNVDGTQNVINAVAEESPNAFIVFASTASVYRRSEAPLDELAPCRPATPYGRSKLEAEQRLLGRVREGVVHGCVLRPAMIFGPGAPGNLARLAAMVRRGWAIEIARGAQRKSIVPVAHAVAAIRAVAARQAACNGEIFNVAGETLTIHEIIAALAASRAAKPHVISLPRWLIAPVSRVGSVQTYSTSAVLRGEKLSSMAGLDAPKNVREALARSV